MKDIVEYTKNLKVLFVEDEQQVRLIMGKLLTKIFDQVVQAENGEEALNCFEPGKFDLIVTDLKMPVLSGFDFIQNVKLLDPNQVVIVTSAYDDSESLLRLINLGVEFFLQKPIEFEMFSKVIQKASLQVRNYKFGEQYKATLEKAVENRTKELTKANRNLTSLNQLKDEFLENISHELKTPLTSILGYAELLQDLLEDNKDVKRILGVVINESEKLQLLIESMINLSEIEAQRQNLKFQKVDIHQLIEDSILVMKKIIEEERRINVDFKKLEPVVLIDCDPQSIDQVIKNILHNAYQYSKNDVEIEVDTQIDGQELIVSIRDQGAGIPEDELEKIFEKFHKIKRKGFKIQGAGIGLAVCKGIIEGHNGRIWAENMNQGTKISFALPLHS